MVADDLSRMTMVSVSHVYKGKKDLIKDVHRLARLCVQLEHAPNGGFVDHNNSKSFLVIEVKSKQHLYPFLMELKKSVLIKLNESFSQGGDGLVRYQGR